MCVKHTNSKNLSVIAHNRDLNVFAIELTLQNVSVIATCLKSFRFNLLNHFCLCPINRDSKKFSYICLGVDN